MWTIILDHVGCTARDSSSSLHSLRNERVYLSVSQSRETQFEGVFENRVQRKIF
jgi:hypothetical protein